jgi:hypothetical protein
MKWQLLCLLGSTLAWTCTISAQQPKQTPKPLETDYYPLKVGHTWTYRSIDVKADAKNNLLKPDEKKVKRHPKVEIKVDREEIYERVTIIKEKDKKTEKKVVDPFMGYLLRATSGSKSTLDHVVVLKEGIDRIHSAGIAINPPVKFFQFGSTADWTCNSETSDGKALKGTFRASSQTVRVPAGEFRDTYVVSFRDGPPANPRLEIDYWFAKDVGMVKQRVKSKNNEVILELEKFDPAK